MTTFLGSRRSIRVSGPTKWFVVDLLWFRVSRALVGVYGYLPARRWHFGSDDESRLSHGEGAVWVQPGPWIDPRDGFDYTSALRGVVLPPLLSLAGKTDRVLGHPSDVKDFLRECGSGPRESVVLSRAAGNRHLDAQGRGFPGWDAILIHSLARRRLRAPDSCTSFPCTRVGRPMHMQPGIILRSVRVLIALTAMGFVLAGTSGGEQVGRRRRLRP